MKETIQVLHDFHPTMFIEAKGPLVSIYLSTHPHNANDQQDRLAYKNLYTEAEKLLAENYSKTEYKGIIEDLKSIEIDPDRDIWRFSSEGLAILSDNSATYIYHLSYPVEERVVVAESFHIKPLIKNFQYGMHHFVLALSATEFRLCHGDANKLEEVDLPEGTKTKFTEVYDDFDSGSASRSMSYGGPDPNYYGQGSKSDMASKDREKFFRYVDKTVGALIGKKTTCPLILVALPQNQSHFRELATIPTLLPQGIEKPIESLSLEELMAETNSIIEEGQRQSIKTQIDQFNALVGKEEASADLRTIGFALVERKVKALFVDKEKTVYGTFNPTNGALDLSKEGKAGIDDLTDDFAQLTYQQDGEVYILEHDIMPTDTGIAAIFRY